ncbi:Oidioi.mRNA.OKI2018_I69.chr1.g2442.t1.cds [Oikopleura dioica]|uniref:Oidioi.mRNA.OKI2018_I69.chr1.g2442.t1.cds n=1 Tax=Oikopleura dioica TaxID=34765 RepID=A0ABN7SWA6_OIKDI|nr:Oidioi.mRNA.OKI2018_I69.chr1.g2442.t1.cds [Oikopleura dioica]
MKHNYQSVSKATGATLITFSIFLMILDSTWIWMDWYVRDRCYRYHSGNGYYYCSRSQYFPMYSWTYG